jgi:outer membrane protein
MKVNKATVLLGALAILALGTAATDDGFKVGVVDIDQAISSTEKGKAAREEFARKQREAQAKIQPLIDKYQALEEELKAKKFVLSDEALFQKQLDLVEMRNQIQSRMKELEGEMQVAQKRIEGPLIARLGAIIEELGKSQGFTLIIRRGAPGVLYTREALDITDIVIERYNQKG